MRLKRQADTTLEIGSLDPHTEWFNGPTRMLELIGRTAGQDSRVSLVHCEPGAMSFWHSHAGGQVIYVLEGSCVVETGDKNPVELFAGDIAIAAPGEIHRHGAGSGEALLHMSAAIGAATWMTGNNSNAQVG